ncbi:sensor histidine kinase [Dyadobacter diqingensis]|uniref:sensor histidine kinase n=1 Tax=Dyadobacter diqingensis TaxID=2938121 RepID=UPI0020C2D563|nr:ATP-binding protein [Dyadobacter diqingensis]
MDKSLYFLRPGKDGTLTTDLVMEGFDFQGNDIKTIYFDGETNRLFLGSQLYGLFIVTKKPFRAVTVPSATPDNVYYGQVLLNNKNILTTKGYVFSLDNATLGAISRHLGLMAKTVDWDQYSIIKDRKGYIWCKRREKLFRFDTYGKRLISTWTINDEIKQLYEGYDGRIWIGTSTLGLYYMDPSESDAHPRVFAGKPLLNISWIQHQTDNMLWIGTGKGLYRIDLSTKKTSYIKGLANMYIRSLLIPEGRNEIWITTYTNGVFLLKNGKLSALPLDKEQYLANAHCILEDKKGFFWITTNKGLFQVTRSDLLSYADKPFELYYHYYSKIAGFNTNEFNGGCQPCAVRIQDGLVSLPSMNGLVWFVPEKIRPELPNREIFIEDLTVDNVGVEFNSNTITLTSKASEVALKVTTPYFGDPYNLRMSYRILKDGEPLMDWKVLNNEIMAISTPPLEAGNYTLSIRKLRGFGLHNYQYKNLHINVKKQWYETWWFRGILVAAVLLIFYGILKQRVKKISKQNLILEAKVNERTQHLEEALRVLNASGKELEQRGRTQIRMIASVTHDVRNPVRHMTKALRYVQDLIEKNQLEAAIGAVKKIEQNSDRIYHLVDNMISFIKPEVYRTNSDFKRANLSALVSERIQIFKEMNGAMINLKISPEHFVNTDPTLLSVVIHNLVDNAIKAKKGNRIEISTESTDEDLHLIFSDEGPGMPRELLGWLNTTSSDENTSLPASYEGLGLLMVKEITKILKIAVYAENNPGARISLKFILDASN